MLYAETFDIEESRLGCERLVKAIEETAEMTFAAYVRIEGRITIPLEIRDALDIKRGDLVECRVKKVR